MLKRPFPAFCFDLTSTTEKQAFNKEEHLRTFKANPDLQAVDILIESLRVVQPENSQKSWKQTVYLVNKTSDINWTAITATLSTLLGSAIYLKKAYYNAPIKRK